jgi:hypothetical protein
MYRKMSKVTMYPPGRTRNSRYKGDRIRMIVTIVSPMFSNSVNDSLIK